MKSSLAICAAAVLAVTVSGCMSSAVSFVPSSIPLEQGRYTELATEITGTSSQMSWLFFTFGAGGSGQRHALQDALDQVDGADGLVAMSVDVEQFALFSASLLPFPILPVFTSTRVTGTPVKVNAQ